MVESTRSIELSQVREYIQLCCQCLNYCSEVRCTRGLQSTNNSWGVTNTLGASLMPTHQVNTHWMLNREVIPWGHCLWTPVFIRIIGTVNNKSTINLSSTNVLFVGKDSILQQVEYLVLKPIPPACPFLMQILPMLLAGFVCLFLKHHSHVKITIASTFSVHVKMPGHVV